jgi:hypothetical protein
LHIADDHPPADLEQHACRSYDGIRAEPVLEEELASSEGMDLQSRLASGNGENHAVPLGINDPTYGIEVFEFLDFLEFEHGMVW